MKKNSLLLTLFLLFGSCNCLEQEPLQEVMGLPCQPLFEGGFDIIDPNSQEYEDLNQGECQIGFTEKDREDNTICYGFIGSQLETCNNLDDDCNGLVDDGWQMERQYFQNTNTCEGIGVCWFSTQKCIDGEWICLPPDNYGEERCDGIDNDCDGEIDEDTDQDPIFDDSERYVYTADPDTINVGECRAGYKECVGGNVSIRNMRTPVTEICGNDDDDDCDGYTDEREDDNISSDIVFIIDYSGSMSGVIQSVSDALCSWSSQGVLTASRFAVVGIGYIDETTDWRETKILTDFTDPGTACDIIRRNNRATHQGGSEYQLDAIYDVNDENSAHGVLSWISDQKKVLVFTDEMMQYSFAPILEDALDMIIEQCMEKKYSIGAFISYYDPNQAEWVDLTQQCGGFLDYLTADPLRMIDVMNYWIGTDC